MLFYYYMLVKMGPLNLWVDMMYSILQFKMSVLEESLKELSPNSRIFVTAASLDSETLQLILLILFRRVILLNFVELVGQWNR